LNIYTTNAVPQYSNLLPVSLQGNTVSQSAFFTISPPEVDFGGLVIGSDGATSGLSGSVILSNLGAQTMNFLGSAWTDNLDAQNGPVVFTNITNGDLGAGFTSSSLPQVGDIVGAGQSLTIPLTFHATATGAYSTFVQWWTTGGTGYLILTASGSTAPVANISVSTVEGGWNYYEPVTLDFGNVPAGTTQSKYIRICNSGGSTLTITKSKPPIQSELLAPNAGTDLHEAQTIAVNSCALGQVSIVAAPLGVNRLDHNVSDIWTLNTELVIPKT
jgi:iron transport multicopper oxidase